MFADIHCRGGPRQLALPSALIHKVVSLLLCLGMLRAKGRKALTRLPVDGFPDV